MNVENLRFASDKILSSMTSAEKEDFLSYGVPLHFKRGKLIFYQEGHPTGAFLLVKGKAKIYKTGAYGKDQIFYIYKEGDLFGYHELLCDENYEESCEVLEDAEVLFFSKMDFNLLVQKIPHLKSLLIQNMSHEFGVLVNTIAILAQKNLRERLALYLIVLNDRYLKEGDTQAQIILPRQDLANIIGTTRESLGRLLKEFREDGLIQIDNRCIQILKINKLKSYAEME